MPFYSVSGVAPMITFTANATAGATTKPTAVDITVSATIPCAVDTIYGNPVRQGEERTSSCWNDPAFTPGPNIWLAAQVDYSLSNWW